MATAHEIALQVLPWFAENVVARNPPLSYGYYAGKIGRDPAKEAIIVGHAMHAIGAVCVIRQLPVAPLHYAKRMDGEARQVFASNKLEADYVLRHVGKMRIVAREYHFTAEEFEGLAGVMRKVLTGKAPASWTPHVLWEMVIKERPKNSDQTYLQRALSHYDKLWAEMKDSRKERKPHG
jgi:hypothetical protein